MSIEVPLTELGERLREFPVCLVLSNGADRPHLVAVAPAFDGERFTCDVGGSTARNAAAHDGAVTLAFTPAAATGWTLVVDATMDEPGVFRPIHAVLHRPAVR
jgi:hypothetical protein